MTPYRLPVRPCEPIIAAVAQLAGLTPSQLRQKSNTREISQPRQLAAYLCRELTGASLPAIGRRLGGQHHTTVLHSCRRVAEARAADPVFDRQVRQWLAELGRVE